MTPLHARPLEEGFMAVPLPDARELSDEDLEALRLRALRGCELGFTEAEVADLLGVCRETVCRWWSAFAHGGVGALPPHRRGPPLGPGRAPPPPPAPPRPQLSRPPRPPGLRPPHPPR